MYLPLLALSLLTNSLAFATNVDELKSLSLVTDIYQDNDDYLWFSTQNGLTRFDGDNTLTFSSYSNQWNAPFSWVNSISPSRDNFIISSEMNGLYVFTPKTAHSVKLELPKEITYPKQATEFKEVVYFQSKNSLYRYNQQTKETRLIKDNLDLYDIAVTNKAAYVLTKNSVYQIKGDTLLIVYPNSIDAYTTSGDYLVLSKGTALFTIDNDRVIAKRNTPQLSALTNENTTTKEDGSIIGVDTAGNVYRFSAKNLTNQSHNFDNIGKHSIYKLFHDNSGVLWVSSNQGINRYYEKLVTNKRFIFDIENNDNELLIVNNQLLIGSFGDGLKTLTPQHWFNPQMNNSLSTKAKYTMKMVLHNNSIIFGTLDGVWQYKLGDDKATRLPFARNKDIILSLKLDGDNLYIGTNLKGVKVYNWQQEKIIQSINKQHGLQTLEVTDVLPLANGDIWLTTANSVEIYSAKTKQVNQTGITVNTKFISLASANGKIYAFSKNSGIYVFNITGDLLSIFGKGIDFGYNASAADKIWVSATSGIYRVNTERNELSLVLGSENYKFSSAPKIASDIVYAWHSMGYTKINYKNTPYYNAKIQITRTNVSGIETLNNSQLKLRSTKDVVTFHLATLDFRSNANKKYKYRVNDNVWVDVNENQITLAGLSSGEYTLEVMGTNSLGQWSNHTAFTNIHVSFPWYWTPQIRVIYLVLVFCIVSLTLWLIYLRTKSISSVYKVLDKDLKTRGILSGNIERNINVSIRLLKNGENEKALKLLSESALLIASNQMNADPNSLHNQTLSGGIEFLVDYWLENYGVNVTTSISYNVDQLPQSLQQSIYRVIFTAIDSAISNSRGIVFNVSMKLFNQKLWLTIEDDNDFFKDFDSRVTFNMAMYTIRKLALKHEATVNAYKTQNNNSQLTLSFTITEHFDNNN